MDLKPGNYQITLFNPETGENLTGEISVVSRLMENKDITMYYTGSATYSVLVHGDDAKVVGAGETAKPIM